MSDSTASIYMLAGINEYLQNKENPAYLANLVLQAKQRSINYTIQMLQDNISYDLKPQLQSMLNTDEPKSVKKISGIIESHDETITKLYLELKNLKLT